MWGTDSLQYTKSINRVTPSFCKKKKRNNKKECAVQKKTTKQEFCWKLMV